MFHDMLFGIQNFKIRQVIIELIAILMMNNFIIVKKSAKMVFHDNSMCKHIIVFGSVWVVFHHSIHIFTFFD